MRDVIADSEHVAMLESLVNTQSELIAAMTQREARWQAALDQSEAVAKRALALAQILTELSPKSVEGLLLLWLLATQRDQSGR